MDPENTRAVHTEIANIFFNQDAEESDETSSEHSVKSGEIYCYIMPEKNYVGFFFNFLIYLFDSFIALTDSFILYNMLV